MRYLVPFLFLFLGLSRAGAQYVDDGISVVDILDRTQSKDPFTAYTAWREFDRWAARQPDPLETLEGVRAQLKGRPLAGLDDAAARLRHLPIPGRREALESDLGLILDRLGSSEELISDDAMNDLEAWLAEAQADAPRMLELRVADAPARGMARAKTRLDQAKRAKEVEEAAREGDALRLRNLLRAIAAPGAVWDLRQARELDAWACEAPETVRALIEPWRWHVDGVIAATAREMLSRLAVLAEWRPVLRAFETLGVPSVRGAERVIVRQSWRPIRPVPGQPADTVQAWRLDDPGAGPTWLFDDATLRRDKLRTEGAWLHPFARLPAAPATRSDLWLAALYGRWMLDQGRLNEALICIGQARTIGTELFPGATPDRLAESILRTGADFLLAQASERVPDGSAPRLWARLAALPFEECRRRAAGELEREKRLEAGGAAWGGVFQSDVARRPATEQVEYWIWKALGHDSELLASNQTGLFIALLDGADAGTVEPLVGLETVPWAGVPRLIEALGDSTPTAQWIGTRRVLVSDAVRFALARHLGGVVQLTWDPRAAAWRDDDEAVAAVQARAMERFRALDGLGESERGWEKWRLAGCPPADFVLQADPALCIGKAWAAIDPGESRRRELQVRRLRRNLSQAPREKLEALLDTTEGDLRALVQQVLDETAPK